MLMITDAARTFIAEELGEPDGAEAPAVRLIEGSDGFSLELDTPSSEDVAYEHAGRTILVVSPDIAAKVEEMILDAVETEEGTTLELAPQSEEDDEDEPSAS